MADPTTAAPIASTASIDRTRVVGAMTLLSGTGVVGLVAAVALRQPPPIAVPPGLVAAVSLVTVRRHLRRQAGAGRRVVSDRSYAVAYPVLAHGVLVVLFAAFVVVHESDRNISESAIHAAYWAAMGAIWLLPTAVQAWRPVDAPASTGS